MITKKALAHISSLEKQIPIWIGEAIVENKQKILDLLQELQLDKGLAYDGDISLGGSTTYAKMTETYWSKVNPPKSNYPKLAGSKYNFKWDGDFFNSLDIRVDKASFEYDIFSIIGEDTRLEGIFDGGSLTKFRDTNNKFINENIIEPYLAKKIQEQLFNF